ncbi:DUF5009 domain-containing protein [Siphonobacter sp. SORGH_AS_0500]|uniref:acyltransferase family protein n=1 Tax=Siphonobacter sp. SORGH_AS_0500 TaxID=1864824 RepID=UPI000CBE5487|nr:DUF5009 domain-containing protein [Siphonobacter sp. SORGH_AS_0500]PKK35991.1 DUF5009 domain-containing protein [Siphonobacter sp. SORGH_AS_0500]
MSLTSTVPEPEVAQPVPIKRLLSLDTLRGFDMFWIMGGDEIFYALAKTTSWSWALFMADQLTHPAWNGFRFYDLIFPLFLFMAGVSTPFSLDGRIARGEDKSKLARKIVSRGITLVILGIILNNGIFQKPLAEMRFGSVLGRIGLAGMFAQLIYLYAGKRASYVWFFVILLGYWAAMMLIPVPGCGAGVLTMECSLAGYLDRLLMPGKLYLTVHDPEGLLSTIPAICNALLGIYAGTVLKNQSKTASRKIIHLVGLGLAFIGLSLLWDVVFPINKNLWTSSFVCVTGGCSLLLLSIFYWIIDVKGYKKWTILFTVIGMNSILIYMSGLVVSFEHASEFFFGGLIKHLDSVPLKAVLTVLGMLFMKWLFLYFLYTKKVFLRV